MKTALVVQLMIMVILVVLLGTKTVRPCADRYELRDSGIVGAVIRLDKQTGETKLVSVAELRAQR